MRTIPLRRLLPIAFLLLASACAAGGARPAASPDAAAALVREAQAFMETYARDLRAGDREAVAARYDRRGSYRMGNGRKAFEPFDSVRAQYLREWTPPRSFQWHDLSYEPVGPDAIVVVGLFDWGRDGGRVLRLSYTGLLVRQDGVLRIRLEDESVSPASLRPPPPAADSTRG